MEQTLEEILKRVNANIDLEAALPTGDELTLRKNYVNQALDDAGDKVQLPELQKEYMTNVATMSTISMPSDFRELRENPQLYSGGSWTEYEEIEPKEKYDKSDGSKYCYVLGNKSSGYNVIFNSPIANATLSVLYEKFPDGMATLTDKPEIASTNYLVKKVESYVFYGRGDERYNIAEAASERKLLDSVARGSKSSGGQAKTTKASFKNPLRK